MHLAKSPHPQSRTRGAGCFRCSALDDHFLFVNRCLQIFFVAVAERLSVTLHDPERVELLFLEGFPRKAVPTGFWSPSVTRTRQRIFVAAKFCFLHFWLLEAGFLIPLRVFSALHTPLPNPGSAGHKSVKLCQVFQNLLHICSRTKSTFRALTSCQWRWPHDLLKHFRVRKKCLERRWFM